MSQLTLESPSLTGARPLATMIVDHAVIARNLKRVAARVGTDVMAVVKADAFGHGAVDVARTALEAGAAWLGVATIDEALGLRRAAIAAPIFAWLIDEWCDLDAALAANITLSCANVSTLEAIAAAAEPGGVVASIHLELDTGMSRGGSAPDVWELLCLRAFDLEQSGVLRITGIWSHLATATDPGSATVQRAARAFWTAVATAHGRGLQPSEFHLANSAAALAHDLPGMTMARIGAALYGIEVVDGREFGLEPAMTVVSRISQLRTVPAGTPVGYNQTFVTTRTTTLALVPIGYADGVPRALSGSGCVAVGGVRCPIRGLVSMDQLVVDVSHADARLGDEIVVLGSGTDGALGASDWARLTGTIPHEILTGFGRRVTRQERNL